MNDSNAEATREYVTRLETRTDWRGAGESLSEDVDVDAETGGRLSPDRGSETRSYDDDPEHTHCEMTTLECWL